MKIEMLKENKLKILLEPDDLKKWGIDASNVLKNEPHSRELFAQILKRAEKETGFSCVNSRLVVESRVNSDKKQLTLYVTKVVNEKEKEAFDEAYSQDDICVVAEEKMDSRKSNGLMVRFKNLEEIIRVSKIFSCFYGNELFSYGENYYVTMPKKLESTISEFGEILSECQRTIVEEHGNRIIKENALFVIREAFN